MKRQSLKYKYFVVPVLIFCFISSCRNNKEEFTPGERSIVQDSVHLMVVSIAKDISHEGPVIWLKYFEKDPGFFMASDGQLVFPNIDTATNFINNTLVKIMPKIELQWSNIHIDPLTKKLAGVSAIYHEDITDVSGKITVHDGYFTGIAHQTPEGWKLRNAHWSSNTAH